MTALRNNFSGGPHGTVLTAGNSGQAGDDPFDLVSTQGTGCVLQFKGAGALDRGTAEFVLNCSSNSTAAAEGVLWSTSMGTQTQVWMRQYMRMDSVPNTGSPMSIFECDNGVSYTGLIDIQPSTNVLKIWNGPTTVSATTSNGIVDGQWFRVEARFQYSTTVGQGELRLFLEPDSDTPTETVSFTGANSGAANSNSFAFGYPFVSTFMPSVYVSGIELNNTGWPGPAPFKIKSVPGIQPNAIAIHEW